MSDGYIDFKPIKPQSVQATFNSIATPIMRSKKTSNSLEADVETFNSTAANIDSTFNKISSVLATENSFNTAPDQDYQYVKYKIDSDTGNYLLVNNESSGSIVYLYSKLGSELSRVTIPNGLPTSAGVVDKYLYIDRAGNLVWKTIEKGLEYYSGTCISIDDENNICLNYDENIFSVEDNKLTIDLSNYVTLQELAQKQDKLIPKDGIYINSENEIGTIFNIEDVQINF